MQCASSTAKSEIRVRASCGEEALVVEALRCDVEELQRAGAEPVGDLALLGGVEARVEPRGVDPASLQEVDLILHQRDQRRDDDRHPVEQQRRQLVAEALARRRSGRRRAPTCRRGAPRRPVPVRAETRRSRTSRRAPRVDAERSLRRRTCSGRLSPLAANPTAAVRDRTRARRGARARRGWPPRSRRRSSTCGRG